jgi:pyrroline-5-carboxylate reductase
MFLVMIGCEKMGGSLLVRGATSKDQDITIINPSFVKVPSGVINTQTIKELTDKRFDIIVVAIKPQLIKKVLPAYRR